MANRADNEEARMRAALEVALARLMAEGERPAEAVLAQAEAEFATLLGEQDLSDRLRMAWPGAAEGDSSSGCGPETPEAGWPSLAERRSATPLT